MWRSLLLALALGCAVAPCARAQGPVAPPASGYAPPPPAPEAAAPATGYAPPLPSPESVAAAPAAPAPGPHPDAGLALQALQQDLDQQSRQLAQLQQAQVAAADPKDADRVQKQMEVLQKQIELLQKMIRLLADQVGRQPAAQVASLESRQTQAARRDQDLQGAVDDLREHVDADERRGPELPWTLKQLFDPFDNNETPLSIYGALAFGYSKIQHNNGGFYFGEFTPDFFLRLNDWVTLEAELSVGSDGTVNAGGFLEAVFFVNDWLSVAAGRFVAPIGWYNLRSNNPWVTKLPTDAPGSAPLLWGQVLPLVSLLGVEAEGSCYLGCSPIKLEYNAYVANGLNFTPAAKSGQPDVNELANLENMEDTFTVVTNDKAIGGRLGLWWPEVGLAGGLSGLSNGDYVAGGFEDAISLWALDLNYHKGDWDLRFEYGKTFQHAADFLRSNIRREGVQAQVAYRPYDCCNKYLQNVELIYRYSYANFRGIDPKALDLTTFSTPLDVPVRRHQHEMGIDYWFYSRLVLKLAYQINSEPGFDLHDNQFIAELAWGW